MAWNHLKLCKNDRVCLLSWKKSFLASQTHFWSFQNFTYGLVSESMIWYLGKSGVKYDKLSKWLEITWNFAKMIAYAFFHEKIIFSQSNSFLEFSKFHLWSSVRIHDLVSGEIRGEICKLSKWLEITWNFAKMIAYFFHEKNHF